MTRRACFQVPDRDPDRPKVNVVLPLVRAYYRKPGNAMGSNCHIVLDDENLDNGSVRWCLARCEEYGDVDGANLMRMMLAMTGSQRRRLMARRANQAVRGKGFRAMSEGDNDGQAESAARARGDK